MLEGTIISDVLNVKLSRVPLKFHFLEAKYLHDLRPYLVVLTLGNERIYRKILKISPSMYKPPNG